jgi:hypothetical protein
LVHIIDTKELQLELDNMEDSTADNMADNFDNSMVDSDNRVEAKHIN